MHYAAKHKPSYPTAYPNCDLPPTEQTFHVEVQYRCNNDTEHCRSALDVGSDAATDALHAVVFVTLLLLI